MKSCLTIFFLCTQVLLIISSINAQNSFPLSIIHLNDMHARFEETNMQSNSCKNPSECIGGYARVVHMVKELKKSRPNPIYLNAADNFQGTLWYSVFRWNVTQYFLNLHPADVMTLGNHEFDHGIAGLLPFLERIKTPIVSCNIDASLEPALLPLFTKSKILEVDGRRIGIVGVTTRLPSDWGNAKILPEVESVREEVENLTSQGIKIIVVLSHAGLPVDREIARNGGPIDIIVGGHSHSFLYSGSDQIGPDKPVDNYPTIEKQESGRNVLIVQASAYTKYLGNITLFFNDEGEIESYEGAPIFLSNDIPQDDGILEELKPWIVEIDEYQNKLIGSIRFDIEANCYPKECSMGNLQVDAMAWAFFNNAGEDEWTGSAIAIQGPGGMRTGLSAGNIVYGDLVATTPFENVLHLVEIPGSAIREALEKGVSDVDTLSVVQVSGIKVVFDLKREAFNRSVEIKVLCQKCNIPKYEPLIDTKIYKVVLTDYVAAGGAGFTMFPDAIIPEKTIIGPRDIDALADYVKYISPINIPPLIGRVKFI